jgi:acyl-CoA reductase-like NAD-dependent aldehyde dehydrogenase
LFIGGSWTEPSSGERITVTSATTEEVIGSVPAAQPADVDAAVAAARRAFEDPSGWAAWSGEDRAVVLERLATELEKRGEELIRQVSAQNGMPITLAQQLEGMFPQAMLRFYAERARATEVEQTHPHALGGSTTVRLEPVGVVAAIAPWNFPQSLSASKYAPALAAGCTVVLKPSPETVLDEMIFAEAVEASGFPPGVVNVLPAGPDASAYLVAHPGVDKVAFTGSTAVGRRIAELCAPLLRPVSLELGGKSAAVVLDDADLDLATMGQRLFGATLFNNGQTCFLSTRILAPRSRYAEVVDTMAGLASSLKVGDALDPATLIGPLVSEAQRARVEEFIAAGRAEGARVVAGGGRSAGLDQGWFVEPTVFADVDNGHRIAREEIFGPVLAVIPYSDVDDAVRIANDSEYGLAGTVWTADPERGMALARRIRTGSVGINTYLPDLASPFGGVKNSGSGRELGPRAIEEYQVTKSIYH